MPGIVFEMRACRALVTAVLVAVGLVGMAVAVMTMDQFRERWHFHAVQRERAQVYAHSPHCRAASRSALGEFHRCGEAEAILASPPPVWHATVDVAKTLPPMLKQAADALRQDMSRILLTLVAVGCVGVWLRGYLAPRPQWHAYSSLPVFKPHFARRSSLQDY